MKKILLPLLALTLMLQSCATLIGGSKKNIFLIDLPEDLVVKMKDKPVEVKSQLVGSESGGANTRIVYKYPGVRLRLKKGMVLDLQSGSQKASSPIKITYKGGDIAASVIGNIFFTFGAGLILDIAMGSLKTPKERFIDVPALLEGRKPRPQKELHERAKGR